MALGILLCAFLFLSYALISIVLAIIATTGRKSKGQRLAFATPFFLLIAFIFYLIFAPPAYTDLMESPDEKLLVGTYTLAPVSYDFLRVHGFDEFSVTIELRADKTFTVTHMPHIWQTCQKDGSGYDNCRARGRSSKTRVRTIRFISIAINGSCRKECSGLISALLPPLERITR